MNPRRSAKNLLSTPADSMEHGYYDATSYVLERPAALGAEVTGLRDALARADGTCRTSGGTAASSSLPVSVRGGSEGSEAGTLP